MKEGSSCFATYAKGKTKGVCFNATIRIANLLFM